MLRIAAIMQLFPIFWGENELRRIKKKLKRAAFLYPLYPQEYRRKHLIFLFLFYLWSIWANSLDPGAMNFPLLVKASLVVSKFLKRSYTFNFPVLQFLSYILIFSIKQDMIIKHKCSWKCSMAYLWKIFTWYNMLY